MARIVAAGVGGADKIFRSPGKNLFLVRRVKSAFIADEKCRPAPDADGAKREGGGDAASIRDSACGNHRLWFDRIDDLRDERKIRDRAGMAACFVALGH